VLQPDPQSREVTAAARHPGAIRKAILAACLRLLRTAADREGASDVRVLRDGHVPIGRAHDED
jgi:hypothetical protein